MCTFVHKIILPSSHSCQCAVHHTSHVHTPQWGSTVCMFPHSKIRVPSNSEGSFTLARKRVSTPCVIGCDRVALFSPNTNLPGRQSKAALEVDLRGGMYFSDVPVDEVVLMSVLRVRPLSSSLLDSRKLGTNDAQLLRIVESYCSMGRSDLRECGPCTLLSYS